MNKSANSAMPKVALLLLLSSPCLLEAAFLGGLSEELVPTQDVREIVLKLRHDVENEIGQHFDSLDAYRFKWQVVAGYVYYISAIARKGAKNTCIHLKVVERPWSDELSLVGLKSQVDPNTPITFRDYSPTVRSVLGKTK